MIERWMTSTTTLADVPERLRGVSFWTHGPTLPLWPLAWLAATVAIAVCAWKVWRRWPAWRAAMQPVGLYVRLGRAQGLATLDLWLLWWIARRARLTTPLTLLVCDATLTHHADAVADDLSRGPARRVMRRVERVRTRLFPADDHEAIAA